MSADQISPENKQIFLSYLIEFQIPQTPTTPAGDGQNSTLQAPDYKNYPTGKNVPPVLKGGADQRVKSTNEIAGYIGDVLKAD